MLGIAARVTVGTLLIVHGFAHWNIDKAWGSLTTSNSWLLGSLGAEAAATESLGTALWIGSLLAFSLAGILVYVRSGWWRRVAVGGAALSLTVMLFFWQPQVVLGVLVDLGVLGVLLSANPLSSRVLPEYLG